jgi:pimeloyl-ACP methyl ester carboxylesterase
LSQTAQGWVSPIFSRTAEFWIFRKDILALADYLNIERFSVLAYSLGGPYGLACAFSIPERLTKVGIVSGAAMFTEPELMKNINEGTRRKFLTMPRENPFASRLFLGMMLGVMPRLAPKQFIAGAASVLPAPDREIVDSDPEFPAGIHPHGA